MSEKSDPGADDPAKRRYVAIQSMRWIGMALVVFGLMIVNRKIDLPEIVGIVLVVIGLVDALIVPTILAKKWKTPVG